MLEMQTRAVLYLFQLECDNTVACSPGKGQQLRGFDLQNLTWITPLKPRRGFVRNSNLWPTLGSKSLSISQSFKACGSVNARQTRVISSG
jgi:hypothetical protein